MIQLNNTLSSWNTADFNNAFKQEVRQLSVEDLQLQQALKTGSFAIKENLQIMINSSIEKSNYIIINSGVFYFSIIAGCNCADDPTPVDLNTEYCELQFKINKSSAETLISIVH